MLTAKETNFSPAISPVFLFDSCPSKISSTSSVFSVASSVNLVVNSSENQKSEMDRLSTESKKLLSKIYSYVKKCENTKSHVNFLQECLLENLVPVGFKLNINRFEEEPENLDEISKSLMKVKLSTFKQKEKSLSRELTNLRFKLKQKLSIEKYQILMSKINKTASIRKHSNKLKKLKKIRKLKKENDSKCRIDSEELARDFFEGVQSEENKNTRKKIKKEELQRRRKERTKLWRKRLKLKKKLKLEQHLDEDAFEEADDTADPLGIEPEGPEDWLNQFFRGVEIIKVKNLSLCPLPESIEAFLSLGAKFTPVQLDIDRCQLEKDLESWFRRLRIKEYFEDKKDERSVEEKRFY